MELTVRILCRPELSAGFQLAGVPVDVASDGPAAAESLRRIAGDVKVDFFPVRASARTIRVLDAFGSLLFGAMGAALAWRSLVGALAVKESGETSLILGWPVWVPQLLMIPGFVLMALAGLYMVGAHLRSPAVGAVQEVQA